MLHFHHLSVCMIPWSDGIWHPSQCWQSWSMGSGVRWVLTWITQLNTGSGHTVRVHQCLGIERGTGSSYNRRGLNFFTWLWDDSWWCLIHRWDQHMPTNQWWNEWKGEGSALPRSEPGTALIPCAWSICVWVYRRWEAEPQGLAGTCGKLSTYLQ